MSYLTAIVPSVGVLFIFVLAIRAVFQADQRERLAQAEMERRQRREAGGTDSGTKPGAGSAGG
jgi:hypothetical protein